MKGQPSSHEKIQQLCQVLERDALEPAREKAAAIVEEARKEAAAIVQQAHEEATRVAHAAQEAAKQERATLEGALGQAARQALTRLRGAIEEELLRKGVASMLKESLQEEKVMTGALKMLFASLAKEGYEGDVQLLLHESLDADKLLEEMEGEASAKLKSELELVKMAKGGVILRLIDQHLAIDCSDEALQELFCTYLRPHFRQKYFAS